MNEEADIVDIIASNAIMLLLKLVGMQASDSERLRLENLDLEFIY